MFALFKLVKNSFLILLFISFSSSLNAAVTADKCVVHLNKSFYVAGEIVWYQLYLPAAFKTKSTTILASVLTQNGEIQDQYFLKTTGNLAVAGYYKIPFKLPANNYLLQFTSLNKATQEKVILVETLLPIYNDLEGIPTTVKNKSTQPVVLPATPENNLAVSIRLLKETYQTREKVTPIIEVRDKNGQPIIANLSISIVDADLVGNDLMHSENLRIGDNLDLQTIQNFSDKLYLTGSVQEDTGQPHTKKILGAYARAEDKIFYTRSKENGSFNVVVPEFYGNQDFQIIGDPADYQQIEVSAKKQQAIKKLPALIINDRITNYLLQSRQRKKIFQEYKATENNIISSKSPVLTKQIVEPDFSFIIREYEDFEFMSIFFNENLTPLRFRLIDSTYIAEMYHPEDQSYYKFFKGKPLIIIDDIATRDGDFLARMRMSAIEKVELIYDLSKMNKHYKLFGSSGVTKITTYDKIDNLPVFESSNIITMNGLQHSIKFNKFNPDELAKNTFQPFFTPQIYWNTDFTTQKDGKTSFDYYHTDDRSTFKINVVAQGEDGEIGYATLNYTVN